MTTEGTTADPSVPVPEAPEPTTFDAEYVKKLRDEAAKYRTEAKANSAAAAKLAALEEAQKSEAQKLTDRVDAAEKEASNARTEALRWRIAAAHGITDEDAELFLTGTDEPTLTKQAERLVERAIERKRNGNVVPNEGKATPASGTSDMREFAKNLFDRA